tara:strand:- start:471 stop:809 length:339 start_codon:yes stop_codon:yes gene_type:complete
MIKQLILLTIISLAITSSAAPTRAENYKKAQKVVEGVTNFSQIREITSQLDEVFSEIIHTSTNDSRILATKLARLKLSTANMHAMGTFSEVKLRRAKTCIVDAFVSILNTKK